MITLKTNLPEFRAQMERLGKAFIPLVGAASRAAAREIAKDVRRMAPRDTGRLQRAIVIMRAKRPPRGSVEYFVGVREGKGQQHIRRRRKGKAVEVNLDAFYWRFLEGGWVPRGRNNVLRGGRHTKGLQARRARASGGRVVRHRFIAPAFQGASGRALQTFYRSLEDGTAKLR